MKALLVLSLMTSCLIFSINSHAAVSVGGTRLVFHGDEKEASITVKQYGQGHSRSYSVMGGRRGE